MVSVNTEIKEKIRGILGGLRMATIEKFSESTGADLDEIIACLLELEAEDVIRFGKSGTSCGEGCGDCGAPCSETKERKLVGATIVISKIMSPRS